MITATTTSSGDAAPVAAAVVPPATPPTETPPKPQSPEPTADDAHLPPPAVPAPQPEPVVSDPRIAPLVAMFPDFDQQLLLSVLDSCDGDQDLAVDMLLEMSNPGYKATNTSVRKTQSQLDEELARRLAQEEEYAAASSWQAQQSRPHRRPSFQQRQSGSDSSGQRQGEPPESDTFAQVQQQVMKLAESGKKTFFSFAQKVKDKIAELDQPSPGDGGSYDGSYAPPPMAQGSGRMFPQTAPPANPPAPAYQPPRGPPPVTHGYDVGPPSGPSVGLSAPVTSPPMAIPTPARPASASTSPSQITGLSTSPAPRASIDAARLGILPKRPVSLMQQNSATDAKPHMDDDDDLEYVENPFDDKR